MNWLKIFGGVGIAFALWVYLPMMDILNNLLVVALGIVFCVAIVEACFGLVGLGMEWRVSEAMRATIDSAKARVSRAREDLAARVEALSVEEETPTTAGV
jgi:hypothetical protein